MRARIQLIVGGLLATLLLLALLPATAASAAAPVLRQGSQGSAVVVLQRDLHLRADGAFGPQTKRAVIAFQRRHHLAADGVVGARTWAALGGAPRTSSPARPVRTVRSAPAGAGVNSSVETAALRLAAAQRGKPYRYGAAGPNSFDCSGLVQYVYRHAGVSVPRTTYTQYAAALHIPRSQMRPGDLIFVDGLSHVGIYAGFGFIWHAPHTGARVKLSLIWDRNYRVARFR